MQGKRRNNQFCVYCIAADRAAFVRPEPVDYSRHQQAEYKVKKSPEHFQIKPAGCRKNRQKLILLLPVGQLYFPTFAVLRFV